MNKNDGGPAFPAKKFAEPGYNGEVFYSYPTGMSLRDWFAGMAMQSLILIGAERVKMDKDGVEEPSQPYYFGNWDVPPDGMAGLSADAYQVADAMLAEREKEPDKS